MKINKFYYYSPQKLTLIEVKNLVPKVIISVVAFFILIVTAIVSINYFLLDNTSIVFKNNQKAIIENSYKKEISLLNKKYNKLLNSVNNLKDNSNDLRLAVNLEPINIESDKIGIGGSKFDIYNHSLDNLELTSVYNYINEIETKLKIEKANFDKVLEKFESNKKLFEVIPAISPVNCAIGDKFGMRYHPILKRKRMHHGLDFLANTGEKVYAPGDGIVTFVGNRGGYGKVIKIDHGYGYVTLYAHLSKFKVKKKQRVKRGDIIALTGNSGSLSTGPHLHYEVRHKGISLNPRNFIFDNIRLFDGTSKKDFYAYKGK
ncbi:MAG: hypothetical protein CR986_00550 [Ignavibacteriae bacterium]|nr:MAG: hypothetical protein CR986_00550 [Ignavibacteriota bacterium]